MNDGNCKICGRDHLPSEPHVWDGRDFRLVPRETKSPGVSKPVRARNPPGALDFDVRALVKNEPTTLTQEVKEIKPVSKRYLPVKNWRLRNKNKYNTYMRDFMRRKRKK